MNGIQAGNAIADYTFANLLRPSSQQTAAVTARVPVNEALSTDQMSPLQIEASRAAADAFFALLVTDNETLTSGGSPFGRKGK